MKQLITNYTFNKTNGQITLTDFTTINLERIMIITNVTAGVVIYQFNSPTKLATVSGNIIDLAYDTSAMNNTDKLMIYVDTTVSTDVTTTANITSKFRDAFETYTPGARWTETTGSGDLIFLDGNAASASYLTISKSPLNTGTESSLASIATFDMPIESAIGLSMSQRTVGQEFAMEMIDTGSLIPDTSDITIEIITQTTTTLTVTTTTDHGLTVGRAIGIRGITDSRLNYNSLVVASVLSPRQFTATAGPAGTIPSQSAYTSSVVAATTAALPAATYANGTLGVGATLTATANGAFPSQDGTTITLNSRVLVKDQASALQNGIYVLTTVGTAGTPWVLTRATDFDTTAEMTVVSGALFAVSVFVSTGATQAQKEYYLSATVTTVGTTAVTFVDSLATGDLGFVYVRQRLGRASNGISEIFENTTVTNASLYIRSESGDALPSGTIAGNQSATIGTTAPIQLAGNVPYSYSFSPTTEYRLFVQADRTQWADSGVDAVAQTSSRGLRTQVCPDPTETYRIRFRANNNKSLTVPNAQIVSAVKSGTTTATITTATNHGLLVGDLVVVYGIRAQGATEFPNLTTATAVASTPSATQFTIVIGTAGTITSYGGYVAKLQGGNLMSALGAVAQVAQSATLTTLTDGTRQLTLVGSANWASPAATIGDLVELVGVRDNSTGATLNVDGPWKIANVSTTSLVLVLPYTGQRVLPSDFGTNNCGGGVIRRTDLRISFVRVFDYERQRVEMLARPGGDMGAAAPVVVQGGTLPTVTTVGTVTTVSTVSAVTSANIAIPSTIADVASAALATTTTTSAITPTFGTAYNVNIPVTVVAGTNPTLDVAIEESDDAGTNWYKVYDFPRITAIGMYRSPILRLRGNRVRYVQTVGGTGSPSFTRAVNRLQISHAATVITQLVDRTIVPNTISTTTPALLVEGCQDFNILVRCTAQTTAATLTLQFSHDNVNWHTTGQTLTTSVGIAHAKVQNEQWKFARLIVTAAGTGITLAEAMITANGK